MLKERELSQQKAGRSRQWEMFQRIGMGVRGIGRFIKRGMQLTGTSWKKGREGDKVHAMVTHNECARLCIELNMTRLLDMVGEQSMQVIVREAFG